MLRKLYQLFASSAPNPMGYTEWWVIGRYGDDNPYVVNGDIAMLDASVEGLQPTEVFHTTDKAQADRIAKQLNERTPDGISYSPALCVHSTRSTGSDEA